MFQLQWTGRRLKKTDGDRKQKACRAPGLVGALPDRGWLPKPRCRPTQFSAAANGPDDAPPITPRLFNRSTSVAQYRGSRNTWRRVLKERSSMSRFVFG